MSDRPYWHIREELKYTGTTARCRKYHPVSGSSGQVLSLSVDGDAAKQGQIIAQLDDNLPRTALNQLLMQNWRV